MLEPDDRGDIIHYDGKAWVTIYWRATARKTLEVLGLHDRHLAIGVRSKADPFLDTQSRTRTRTEQDSGSLVYLPKTPPA